ncbi:MazG-like family protein [Anaerocolumna sp. AGMB13025]|uniref:MazG-like family protein n=1 Tax=Anaerocolumna sp. AGMB13025 TaxID=3039116 RepID=UPI00241EEF67|nr:MazG-like family protein [Anaerocolumna sp. AGMB13025]WFR58159.1 MazG-like family protein [Anaerocolumna sp. AGMB13025]
MRLCISISLEAVESLEVFQWSGEEVKCTEIIDKIKVEIADVVNYCVLMSDACRLNLDKLYWINQMNN